MIYHPWSFPCEINIKSTMETGERSDKERFMIFQILDGCKHFVMQWQEKILILWILDGCNHFVMPSWEPSSNCNILYQGKPSLSITTEIFLCIFIVEHIYLEVYVTLAVFDNFEVSPLVFLSKVSYLSANDGKGLVACEVPCHCWEGFDQICPSYLHVNICFNTFSTNKDT